jgi:peptide/nickel transport system permease protein
MTVIVRHVQEAPPPVVRAGLVWPGLGHLLAGEWLHGVGLMACTAVLAAAAVSGFPSLGDVVWDEVSGVVWGGVAAVVVWVLLALGLWTVAWRRVHPRVLDEDERGSNRELVKRALLRHHTGMLGLYGILVLSTAVAMAPLLASFDPLLVDAGPPLTAPGAAHFLGTDEFGRDVWSRLLYGGRISLSIGFVAVGISATVGTLVGSLAAFAGGLVDRASMFVVDALLSLPRLVLLLTVVGLFRTTGAAGLFVIVAVLGMTSWMGISRIVRSEVLSLREREFVQAARALGLSPVRILLRHLVPNAMGPVIVFCSLAIGGTMLAEASLSFLGLGVPPPVATWGVMINDGRERLRDAVWVSLFPGLAIMWGVLSFNLLGDGLRDALDPKQRG